MPLHPFSFQPRRKPLRQAPTAGGRRDGWFGFLLGMHRSATFRALFWSMALVGVYSAALVWWLMDYLHYFPPITVALHSMLGITLGLLLVIRTNTAYDRWWEGRKLVGALVNSSRNLALKLQPLLAAPEYRGERLNLAALISSYALALRDHLRDRPAAQALTDLNAATRDQLAQAYHLPNAVAARIHLQVDDLLRAGVVQPVQQLVLNPQIEAFTDIVGACERIKRSPLPAAYNTHLKLFIMVYVLTLPLGLIKDFSYYAAPAAMLVYYAMAGLEFIAEEIEEPFGTDSNDIPMDDICQTIRHNVYEILAPETLLAKPPHEVEAQALLANATA